MKKIVVIGSGPAGLEFVKKMSKKDTEITLIDKRNHNIFQPLLYQVATSYLSPSDIASPIRDLVSVYPNVEVVLAEVTKIDADSRKVYVSYDDWQCDISYDYLVIASGLVPNYFSHPEFSKYSPALKNISDAVRIRNMLLSSFEIAERMGDSEAKSKMLSYVLVGAGPNGVELAASLSQYAANVLKNNYKNINFGNIKIHLVEGGGEILPSYHPTLSKKAEARLNKLGISVVTNFRADKIDNSGIYCGTKFIASNNIVWTAGVKSPPFLNEFIVKKDSAGRLIVTENLNLEDYQNVFVIGDIASHSYNGKQSPGLIQNALQQGRFVAKYISAFTDGREYKGECYRYKDKGSMTVIGSNYAILQSGRLKLSGVVPFYIWVFIHILALPYRQNRFRVQFQWVWNYVTGQRSSRIITEKNKN
ncbi:NADH dehydrogenase [Serratia marcescens]|nr:NADH dehydrogenase [Serratia marcescens]